MDDALAREVAASLDATPELMPLLPELLADLVSLGGSVEPILEAVASLGLPAGARALDLGCGKGAVAVAAAQRLGLQLVGIDAFAVPPGEAGRLNEANTRAIRVRAEALAARHPEHAKALRAYVAEQERASGLEGRTVVSALWILGRR